MQINNANRRAALKIMRILGFQDYFQTYDETQIDYLMHAILKHAKDEEHIQRIVDTWVLRTRKMMHPSDVPGLARETATEQKLPKPCPQCVTTDWVLVIAGDKEGVERCSCERGRQLAKIDALTKDDRTRAATAGMIQLAPRPPAPDAEPSPTPDTSSAEPAPEPPPPPSEELRTKIDEMRAEHLRMRAQRDDNDRVA